jgi:SAM-dependent methyltransferase
VSGAAVDGRSFAAAQSFLLATKSFWTQRIYPEVRAEYEHRVARQGLRPATAEDAQALMSDSTLYAFFAWLERHLQRYKYSGRYGLQAWHAQDRARLEALLEGPLPPHLLELAADFELPRYYTGTDIHQHPGGVWSDPIAGFVYERGARSTTPLAGARHADLHDRLTELALRGVPGARKILDLGCGFGKSTRPLRAPCLKLAARTAADAGARNVRFRQADAARTGCADASFDLVTSTMLLHEMPPPVVERTLAEAARVLKPGGRMVHLDFLPQAQPRGDAFARFVHYGHGRRNNEPFMAPLAEMDLAATLERLGFANVEIRAFEESEGALAPDYASWRFPWTVIIAEKRREPGR